MRTPTGDRSRRGVHPLTEDSLLFDGPRTTYGRFRVLHQIGAGSVGPVFRGEDPETHRAVAIKVIRVGLTPERVSLVASALGSLKDRLTPHAALATMIDTGVRDVEPFLVCDFVDGDSLDVALREFGPAHMRDALPRLRLVADALDMAAARGLAHGSLHLRDIVVSPDLTVLTGLGVAPILERVGVRPPVRRPYCAPEVAAGHGITPAADQFSLAAIAHEWLSGRRIAGPGAEGFHVPALSPESTEAAAAVFVRALDESPDARYPTASAFVAALAEIGDVAPPRAKSAVRRRPPAAEAPRLSFDVEDAAPVATPARVDLHDTMAAPPSHDATDVVAALEAQAEPSVSRSATRAALAADLHDRPGRDATSAATGGPSDWDVAASAYAHQDGAAEPNHDDDAPGHRLDTDEHDAVAADDAYDDAPDDSDGDGRPRYWLWGAAGVVLAGLMALGGWALVRWGTPARQSTERATAAPAVVTIPPVTTSAAPPAGQGPAVAPTTAAPPRPAVTTPAEPPAPAPEAARVDGERSAPVARSQPAPASTTQAARSSEPRTSARAPAVPPAAARRAAAARPTPSPRARPAAPAPAAGRLLVRTTPAGAEVFVNGTRRGVSPLAVRDLAFGAYAVRVTLGGHASAEQRVTVDAGRPSRTLELTLAAAAPAPRAAAGPGSLAIDSRPAGARVWVDGRDVGLTPVTVPGLAPGEHAVRVQRAGFLTISTTANVTAGARARLGVSLTSERPQ